MSFQKRVFFLLVLAIFCTPGHTDFDPVRALQSAYNGLKGPEKQALNALGPNFFAGMLDIVKCIAKEALPINVCNLKTSYDPYYYVKKCANGTKFQEVLLKSVREIPVVDFPFGIPPTVSKDRCFKPTSVPTIPTPTLPSVITPPSGISGLFSH